uniref:Uncharacterized protein n=1 Tax=Alexandrium monilatum TaxID=311494 RepID=A0A7S4Q1K0_9DINO
MPSLCPSTSPPPRQRAAMVPRPAAARRRTGSCRATAGRALRLLSLAEASWVAQAWGREGHRRIAEVAEKMIVGSGSERIHAMLQGNLDEFVDLEQKMGTEHPETAVLHWHSQEPEWNCSSMMGEHGHISCDGHSAAKDSLYCAALHFSDRLGHEVLTEQFPRSKGPPELASLAGLSPSELGHPQLLRWLVILLGDMHQPLRWLRAHDYGREVQLRYKGQTYSLLSFWEEYLPQQLAEPNWNHLKRSFHKHQGHYLERLPATHFRNWARDHATAACSLIYAPLEQAGGVTSAGQEPLELEEELFAKWQRLATELISVAGQRVAVVLLDVLRHDKHRTAYKEGHSPYHPWLLATPTGFALNALIALPVVPGVLGLFLLHERWVSGRRHISCMPKKAKS